MIRSCPGRSLRRSRSSFGMTTWNFGDTFTVCMGVYYGKCIDIAVVCQYSYRLLYRITIAKLHVGEIRTPDAGEGPERKPVRGRDCTLDGRRTVHLTKQICLATREPCS